MNRRRFLNLTAMGSMTAVGMGAGRNELPIPQTSEAPLTLPGTALLTEEGDPAPKMVDGIHSFLHHRTANAIEERQRLWNRDYTSPELYNRSVVPNRERFRAIVGAVDPRVPAGPPDLVESVGSPALISSGSGYRTYAVRWAVLGPVVADFGGLEAEGLLLQPEGKPVARVVAVPDADWPPEALVGLSPGVPAASQFARRLAENGCQVVIPLLINRDDTYSGVAGMGFTNQPHREWIYRMAYEVGRHVIGYEVQKILAAVDWFASQNTAGALPIGVMGYGEGALLALYSAALDSRINATVVSGYFQEREEVWQEPIYRDVWGGVREFGDAELASLIAPRGLIVEACRGPEVDGPPPVTESHHASACPNGKLVTPPLESVQKEVQRARGFFDSLKSSQKLRLVVSGDGRGTCGSEDTLRAFLQMLGLPNRLRPLGNPPVDGRRGFDFQLRLHRQLDQTVGFTQALIRKSPERRKQFWAKANSTHPLKARSAAPERSDSSQWSASPEVWKQASKPYRDHVWEEVIGRLPAPNLPANPRTKLIFDEARYRGYAVMLDVWPDVFAYGILLVPKDIQPGERRPVVVCQHGLEGSPRMSSDRKIDSPEHQFAVRLAEEGFVTYAPLNPYVGMDRFRMIQRMGHPLKLALFSFIIGQHQQTLDWLATQPFVDPERIGFYGISYGGKTAIRVPPFVERYALSICTADFNEWVWKTTNVDSHYSYMFSGEYDMYEFNFANVVNYAELANLVAPRPFMVERGHNDTVSSDDKVAEEYALVRWFYAYLGIPDRTTIEFFDGPHEIHGVGTFEFLRKHLRWPNPGLA